jgi:GNAT superfamily N-acetyltransferase
VLFIKSMLVAYVTVLADRIMLGPSEKPKGVTWQFVGALKIAQLAVDLRFAGHGLGKLMTGYVIEYARTLRTVIGCRYVTLDAEPDLVAWYEAQGFIRNQQEQAFRERLAEEAGRPSDRLPCSMRFDLRDVKK